MAGLSSNEIARGSSGRGSSELGAVEGSWEGSIGARETAFASIRFESSRMTVS